MTKEKFEKAVRQLFEMHGYTKIKITAHVFSMRMNVSAKDKRGKRCEYECTPESKHGRDYIAVKNVGGTDWVDELEALDAIFDD